MVNKNYPRNSSYFSNIDTPAKAYWLGFFYADGTVNHVNNEISISSIDKEHVEKFRTAIEAVNNLITEVYDSRWKNAKILYRFGIKDKTLHEDLIKWGCVPRKTFLINKIPNIPRDYTSHFLRGYFDGDGSLHWLKGTQNYRISFTSGSKEFLQEVAKELYVAHLSIGNWSGHTYQLQIAGRKQVERVLNYLYQDSTPETRLNRKYETYLKCLSWAHRH